MEKIKDKIWQILSGLYFISVVIYNLVLGNNFLVSLGNGFMIIFGTYLGIFLLCVIGTGVGMLICNIFKINLTDLQKMGFGILIVLLVISGIANYNYYWKDQSNSNEIVSLKSQLDYEKKSNKELTEKNNKLNTWKPPAPITSPYNPNKYPYTKPKLKEKKEVGRYRVGAECWDGTFSSATGRGACSWHGGVKRWIYNTDKK